MGTHTHTLTHNTQQSITSESISWEMVFLYRVSIPREGHAQSTHKYTEGIISAGNSDPGQIRAKG